MPRGARDDAIDGMAAGINWEPGEEDYPFAAIPGETALDYFARWLDQARLRPDRAAAASGTSTRADVANVLNHITADVGLLRARLGGLRRPGRDGRGVRRDDGTHRAGGGGAARGARHAPAIPTADEPRPPGARRAAMKVLVLHGVNLDMFGKRDPGHVRDRDAAGDRRRAPGRSAPSSAWRSSASRPTSRACSASGSIGPTATSMRWSSTPAPGPTTATRSGTRWRSCGADRRGPHVEHPRTRAVPAPLGARGRRQGPDRRVRRGQLPAGAARRGLRARAAEASGG